MSTAEPAWVIRLRRSLIRMDSFMAAGSLLLLLVLVCAQVVLRNLFNSGIPHMDILARYLVLYVTFFGAALAIEEHRHIRIDIVAAFLQPPQVEALRRPLYLIAAGVCFALTWAGMRFWYDDWQYVAEHERWSSILALILPFGFALLSVHFLLGAAYPAEQPDKQS